MRIRLIKAVTENEEAVNTLLEEGYDISFATADHLVLQRLSDQERQAREMFENSLRSVTERLGGSNPPA